MPRTRPIERAKRGVPRRMTIVRELREIERRARGRRVTTHGGNQTAVACSGSHRGAKSALRLTVGKNLRPNINSRTLSAVIPVTLGIVVLAYSGISFTTPGKPIEFLGLHIATAGKIFIPPVIGALALVGGIVLLMVKPRRSDAQGRSRARARTLRSGRTP